jgi:superfamily I DNA/RNA helicase
VALCRSRKSGEDATRSDLFSRFYLGYFTQPLDFPGTEQILLEENYRSTGAILKASLAIVAQGPWIALAPTLTVLTTSADRERVQKALHTSHPLGITPVLRSFPTEHEEATFLAVEIKRIVAHMGGVLRWGDFVVLREMSSQHNFTFSKDFSSFQCFVAHYRECSTERRNP